MLPLQSFNSHFCFNTVLKQVNTLFSVNFGASCHFSDNSFLLRLKISTSTTPADYLLSFTEHLVTPSHSLKSLASEIWKLPKCPSTDEWIKNKIKKKIDEWIKRMWYIDTMEYNATIKKNEILPSAATWIDLEGIMLSEISQTKKDKYRMISLICGI